jgi:hypothetical protein
LRGGALTLRGEGPSYVLIPAAGDLAVARRTVVELEAGRAGIVRTDEGGRSVSGHPRQGLSTLVRG